MKNKVTAIVFLLLTQYFTTAQIHYTNLDDAKKIALATNSLIVIDFWAAWCKPCVKMNEKTWPDAKVQESLKNFIFVKINTSFDKATTYEYKINAIPAILIVDANGVVYDQFVDDMNATETLSFLDKNALNTEFISLELIAQHKAPTYNNALRLVYKMYEYSLYAEDITLKNKVINVCEKYIDIAKDLIDSKDEKLKVKKQKIQLIEYYKYAYNFDFENLKRKIDKISYDAVYEEARYDYLFLAYLSAKVNNQDTSKFIALIKETNYEKAIDNVDRIWNLYLATEPKK